tara:strand:+ start:337 stop:606 length:270 start_codon:yes stop_codon:yes gene_type:complete
MVRSTSPTEGSDFDLDITGPDFEDEVGDPCRKMGCGAPVTLFGYRMSRWQQCVLGHRFDLEDDPAWDDWADEIQERDQGGRGLAPSATV